MNQKMRRSLGVVLGLLCFACFLYVVVNALR